jgi:putative inorganic carbon (HCO3(-)) transporter
LKTLRRVFGEEGPARALRAILPGLVLGVLAGAAAMRFLSLPTGLIAIGAVGGGRDRAAPAQPQTKNQIKIGAVAAAFGLAALAKRKTGSVIMALLMASLIVNIDKTFFLNADHSGGAKGVILSLWNFALLGVIVLRVLRSDVSKAKRPPVPMWVALSLLLLYMLSALSLTQAISLRFGLFQLFELTKVLVLFLFLIEHFRDRDALRKAVLVLFVVYLFELAIGTVQYTLNRDVNLGILKNATTNSVRQIGDRAMISVSGTLDGSDRFSSYLVMMLILFMGWLSTLRKAVPRLLLLTSILAGTMLLVFTFSRGGWIGFSVGLCVYAGLHWIIAENKSKALFRGLAILAVLTVTLWALKDFILLRFTGDDYGSAQSRIPMMQIAFGMIRRYPWLGVGLNNYTLAMIPFDKTGLTIDFFHPVHNVYLQMAAEIGLPGLTVFLAFTCGLYIRALKSLFGRIPHGSKQLIIGCISGITGLLVHYTVNNATIDSEAFLVFWVFAAAIIALSVPSEEEAPAHGGGGGADGLG